MIKDLELVDDLPSKPKHKDALDSLCYTMPVLELETFRIKHTMPFVDAALKDKYSVLEELAKKHAVALRERLIEKGVPSHKATDFLRYYNRDTKIRKDYVTTSYVIEIISTPTTKIVRWVE